MARGNDCEFELSQEQGSKIRLEGSRASSRSSTEIPSQLGQKIKKSILYILTPFLLITTKKINKNQFFKEKSEIPLQNN